MRTIGSASLISPRHQPLYPADTREVVVDHRDHEKENEHKSGQKHLLFYLRAEVAPGDPLERHDEDVPSIEDRDRHEVEKAEVEADGRQQRQKRDDAERGRFTRQLSDSHRPHQLTRRCRPDEQAAEGLEDQSAELDVALNAQLYRLERTGLERLRLLAEVD